jgi:hypothetical protein
MANGYEPGDYLGQFLQQLPQIYQARQNAQLQRERFEYYKGKDADAAAEVKRKEAYNQNVRAWTQMQNFAQEMPFGQQANFLRKQLDTLPQDFIESQNLDKFIDNYGIIEDNEVDQRGIFDNVMDEDNPNKIRFSVDYLEDPRRKKQALSQAKKLESQYGKQKPFDINKLTYAEQRLYKLNESLLSDAEQELVQASEGLPGQKPDPNKILAASQKVKKYKATIEPYVQKGAPITIPEFNYSPESLKALTDDPDLMSSFLAAPEDDMDAYYNAYKNPDPDPDPDPEPDIDLSSIWEPYTTRITTPKAGGGTKVVEMTDYKLKSGLPTEYEKYSSRNIHQKDELSLVKDINRLEQAIVNAENNIATINRQVGTGVQKAGMGPTSIIPITRGKKAAEQQRANIERFKKELESLRKQYETIRRPKPEVALDAQ